MLKVRVGVLVPPQQTKMLLQPLLDVLRLTDITLPRGLVHDLIDAARVNFVWQTQLLFV
jgi:hypothetical protein